MLGVEKNNEKASRIEYNVGIKVSFVKDLLGWRHKEGKAFLQQFSLLRNTEEKTDWNKVADLYMEMENEIEGGIC